MIIKESIARDLLRLVVWYPLRWLVVVLPLRLDFKLLRFIGDIHYFVQNKKTNIILKNLRSVFNARGLQETDCLRILRNYYRNHYVSQLQIFIFPKLNEKNIGKIHRFAGLENLNEALKGKKGCVLLHAHFGPAQLPLHALGIEGYSVTQLGLPTDEGLSFIGRNVAFRLRLIYENKIRGRIISTESFLRPLFKALKNNDIVFMTGDGAGGNKFIGKFAVENFLGNEIKFTLGSKIIAEKTGACVLPLFTVQEGDTYITHIYESLNPDGSCENIISDFSRIFESHVTNYPSLWHFWDEFDKRIVKKSAS